MPYLRYKLRTIYHCTPAELRQQRGEDVIEMLRDITCLSVEREVERRKRKRRR